MIIQLVTGAHTLTHAALQKTGRFDLRTISYQRAIRWSRWLPRATYLFTDVDRLSFWELELAARLYRDLAAAELRVLNDPARVRQRFSLLRTLKDRGLNQFDVWRVEDTPRPDRYPVFLRLESAHRPLLSDLLHDEVQVREAIDHALAQGYPRREMILVEFCAQPLGGKLFRKLAMFRVGDRLVPTLGVHDLRWKAKGGKLGAATQEVYDDEHAAVTTNRYAEALRPAFDAAEIDYGRADFGLVDNRPQIYEINTNPFIGRPEPHPFPIRTESGRLAFEMLLEAFEAIDTPAGGRVRIQDWIVRRQRRKDRWMTQARWTP